MIVEGPDGIEYGHAADCARLLAEHGVPNAHDRVRDWIRRDLVKPVTSIDGRPVYSMADLRGVELRTRKRGRRRNAYVLAF